MKKIKDFSREDLLKLIEVYAKNWLAHDGCWFLAAEEKFDMETAIELDKRSWERFAVTEACRIMKVFSIPKNGRLKALEKALHLRLYAPINIQETQWINDNELIFRMVECRVQRARRNKQLSDFPCKPVGIIEFSQFAKTVDPRIKTECIKCPPDAGDDHFCSWRFTIEG